MFVLGLTGSIGMGKSFAARAFARDAVAVYDADGAVHRLIGPGGSAVAKVAKVFSGVRQSGPDGVCIDRGALAARVFGDDRALARLEAILHPLVRLEERQFLEAAERNGERLAVLEVPLLFETGGDTRCDAVAVVCAPSAIQRARVMRRPGMTLAKLGAIRKRQMPDREKCRRADFVISTGIGTLATLHRVRAIARMLKSRSGRKWPACWKV